MIAAVIGEVIPGAVVAQPLGVAMGLPEGAKPLEEFRGDRDLTRLAAFALGDANEQALSVDVLGFDVDGLAQAQPALVNDSEVGAVATVAKGAQKQRHFSTRKNVGERFGSVDPDLLPDVPVATQMMAVEEPNGAESLVDGTPLQLSLLLKVDEEIKDLLLAEPGRGGTGIVEVELSNPPEVILFGLVAESSEMDKADEILVPLCRSDGVV